MKNYKFLKYTLILAFVSSLFLIGCDDSDKGMVVYGGENRLTFSKGTSTSVFVVEGTNETLTKVYYGPLKATAGSHSVKLVPNTAESTAVLGVDYVLVNDTDQLVDGEIEGSFVVRFLESGATLEGKTVVFNLESSTLPVASFNSSYSVNVKLTCPVDETKFVGAYLIQELTPYVDGPTLNDGQVVQVSLIDGSTSGRTFMTQNYPNYCSPLREFNFDLVCGSVVVRANQRSTCQCTTAGLFFGPATVNSTFNANDDSYFEMTFTNDVTGNCSPATQTTYSFTKQ